MNNFVSLTLNCNGASYCDSIHYRDSSITINRDCDSCTVAQH